MQALFLLLATVIVVDGAPAVLRSRQTYQTSTTTHYHAEEEIILTDKTKFFVDTVFRIIKLLKFAVKHKLGKTPTDLDLVFRYVEYWSDRCYNLYNVFCWTSLLKLNLSATGIHGLNIWSDSILSVLWLPGTYKWTWYYCKILQEHSHAVLH